jgi:hypothetical protein
LRATCCMLYATRVERLRCRFASFVNPQCVGRMRSLPHYAAYAHRVPPRCMLHGVRCTLHALHVVPHCTGAMPLCAAAVFSRVLSCDTLHMLCMCRIMAPSLPSAQAHWSSTATRSSTLRALRCAPSRGLVTWVVRAEKRVRIGAGRQRRAEI